MCPISREEHKKDVLLEDVKPEDTKGIKSTGTMTDTAEFMTALENSARDELIAAVRKRVEVLPAKIYQKASDREKEDDLDGAGEAYLRFLNLTKEDNSVERMHAKKFLMDEFQYAAGIGRRPVKRSDGRFEAGERRDENVDSPGNKQSGEITRIGKYEIIDVLGRGGMGVVYRGIDKQIGREVAIKTLTQGFLGDDNMLARFYEEGRRTGRLNHPNIVIVYDLGDDNGTPYIVMERVAGRAAGQADPPGADPELSLADRLGVLKEVCEALGYAHRNNVIHRDVKPANIFVQPDGTAKLLDFGIARLEKREGDQSLTRTGHLIGTVPYMAPERLRNEPIDGRSDIFAAGVVLFQLVAGQLPFSGADNVLMNKILNEPHPRLDSIRQDLPASLELIVDRALAKSLDERYPTAEEMAADLTAVIVELRQEEVQELLPEAKRLMEAEELTRARDRAPPIAEDRQQACRGQGDAGRDSAPA